MDEYDYQLAREWGISFTTGVPYPMCTFDGEGPVTLDKARLRATLVAMLRRERLGLEQQAMFKRARLEGSGAYGSKEKET